MALFADAAGVFVEVLRIDLMLLQRQERTLALAIEKHGLADGLRRLEGRARGCGSQRFLLALGDRFARRGGKLGGPIGRQRPPLLAESRRRQRPDLAGRGPAKA